MQNLISLLSSLLAVHNKTLIILSVTGALAGVALLALILLFSELPAHAISNLTLADEGKVVKITGTVGSVRDGEKVVTFVMYQEVGLQGIIFKKKSRNLNLANGDRITVQGTYAREKGIPQIIVDKYEKKEIKSQCRNTFSQ